MIAKVWANLQHTFWVIKRQFGHLKTRSRPDFYTIRARQPVPDAKVANDTEW
jgi:hypothetical protein